MCGSDDDYFADDWVLDDKTLAVLDEEESKFRRATSTQTRSNNVPPAKRQKTGSWQAQSVTKTVPRMDTLDDMEDLPDVSVRQDGTYGLLDRQGRASVPPSRSRVASGSAIVMQADHRTRPPVAAPASRGSAPSVRRTPGIVRAAQAPSRPFHSVRGTRTTNPPVPSQSIPRTEPQHINGGRSSTAAPNAYVEQLLQQIERLRKENEACHAEMESALEAKFAKEGEVTILRKRMEKTAQEHLAQLAKLKSAKDDADVKHVLLQKQYETDKERLKTELTFRRHELETFSRKSPASHSPKKDVSQTAGPLLSQRQKSFQRGPSRIPPETPHRPRFGVISDIEKPKKVVARDTRDLPTGFQTSIPRSQFVVGHKGKETNPFSAPPSSAIVPNASPVPEGSSSRFAQPDVFGSQPDDGGLIENFAPQADVGMDDVQMADEGTPIMTLSSQENTNVLVPPSSNLILHGVVMTHTLRGSKTLTLQLLGCVFPADTAEDQSYGAALMRIFDTLGAIPAHPDGDFDRLAAIICCALCEITHLLAKNNLILPLTAVLNLLTNLAYMLPSSQALLIWQHAPDREEMPQLLEVLHHIFRDHLQKLDVTAGNEPPELCSLGRETLALYEALVWDMADDLEDRFSALFPSMPSVFTTLLHPNRPAWFLIASTRVLLWLSKRRGLCRSLLSHPTSEQVANNGEPRDVLPRPEIGLACSLLADSNRHGPEADELKSRIILFFGMLSNSHPGAYTMLVDSQELIPSIVLCLCQKVTPIWDEDGEIFSDPQAATRAVYIINDAALLLHHLVNGEDATLDLRECLLRAPAKTYQGLVHSFILTFGRLSYANPPYWLEMKNRERLLGVADLARALLERVIQGPELDLIWETYQDEGEEGNDTAMDVDDEEAEVHNVAKS